MNRHAPLRKAARIAFFFSLLLLLVKFSAYFLTDSKAILSDAIESIINVVTGAFLMVSIVISTTPVDADHPYGHGKIEAFSSGLEGGLIILAAFMILVEAVPGFFAPAPPRNLGYGILLLLGSGGGNCLVGLYLLRSGKKYKSEALAADGHHLLTDFYTSGGVVVGLTLVRLTGLTWLDPLTACLVAVNILVPGIRLVRRAVRNLMNEADPEFLGRVVEALNRLKQPGWLHPHKLRGIRSGRYHHIDLHISLPRHWTLDRVHQVEQEISDTLLAEIGEEGDVMVHVDPCEDTYCPCCGLEPCPDRDHDGEGERQWSMAEVIGPRPTRKESGKI